MSEQIAEIVEMSKHHSLDMIRRSYEEPGRFEDVLLYHATSHTIGAVNRVTRMIGRITLVDPEALSPSDIAVIKIGMDKHDTVQISNPVLVEHPSGKWMVRRQRATGTNEEESARVAEEFLNGYLVNNGLVSKEDRNNALQGILLTKPAWSSTYNTVIQEGFAEAPLEAQLIALSDLAGSGMDGGEVALFEAATLFAEENIDYTWYRELITTHERRLFSPRDKAIEDFFHERALAWIQSQIAFTRGRSQLVWQEIDNLHASENAKDAVRSCFSQENFQDSIMALEGLYRKVIDSPEFDTWTQVFDKIIATIPHQLQDAAK